MNSGLKLLLYGTRFRINYCPPGNIGNWSLQHSPESSKYWKTTFFDSVLSWKYWKTDVFQLPHILEILENGFFQLTHILEIVDRTIHTQSYPGNTGSYDPCISPILEILEISVWIGHMSGCVYNLCFAVEPPRRGFFFCQKQHVSDFWTCPISGNSTFH